ncbi:hypothetical protein VER_09605 [Veillonella sp. R32]|nr:hypothetical protein VER_09605 [Veillonella sp. R32]
MKLIVREILTMFLVYIISTMISVYFILPLGIISIIIGVPILKCLFCLYGSNRCNVQVIIWVIGNILIIDNEYSFFFQEYSRSIILSGWKNFIVFFHTYITNNDFLFLIVIKTSIYIMNLIKKLFSLLNFNMGRDIIDIIQTTLVYFIMQLEIIFWICLGSRIYKKLEK